MSYDEKPLARKLMKPETDEEEIAYDLYMHGASLYDMDDILGVDWNSYYEWETETARRAGLMVQARNIFKELQKEGTPEERIRNVKDTLITYKQRIIDDLVSDTQA